MLLEFAAYHDTEWLVAASAINTTSQAQIYSALLPDASPQCHSGMQGDAAAA